jgi:hypothetical protein
LPIYFFGPIKIMLCQGEQILFPRRWLCFQGHTTAVLLL